MFDVALSSAGAQVCFATSSHEDYSPDNIIDGSQDTFWASTGLFPQEFIITFASLMNLNNIKLEGCNVKQIVVERSVQNEPVDFEPIAEKELEGTAGQQQFEEFSTSGATAQHLRFTIKSGHDHFLAIHKISVDGTAIH